MEDVKWLLKKCGLPFLILLFAVIAGVICWGKLHTEERKVAEEVWEPPVEIENSEATTEADAETSGRLPEIDGKIHIGTKLCELQRACHKLRQ